MIGSKPKPRFNINNIHTANTNPISKILDPKLDHSLNIESGQIHMKFQSAATMPILNSDYKAPNNDLPFSELGN